MKKLKELTRDDRAQLNILSSFGTQIITVICSFIIPRLIISNYGSEQYGAVSSITQFLGYITLLEGGICGVARAALYKTIANKDYSGASEIVHEIDVFFKKISVVFVAYVIGLAFSFKYISNAESLDYISSIFLVLAISVSTIAQYLFGIKNVVFLQAAQRAYIINIVTIMSTVGNTVFTVILVLCGQDLIVVKLASSLIFLSRPILLSIYVKRKYQLTKKNGYTNALSQKWEAFGQHIAYFIHSNTDILVLTIFADLKNVAIYSVYHMIVVALQNLIYSFSNGMEPLFGELISRHEQSELNKKVSFYETLISIVSTIVFLTTAVLIVPFISIYTKDLTDTNYYQPVFSFLLVISATIFCVRLPYHAIVIAAGRFKETRIGAYGEAVLNLILSVLLVNLYGLIGVAVGTIIGCSFRLIYYINYLSKNILQRSMGSFIKRQCYTFFPLLIFFILEYIFVSNNHLNNYMEWFFMALIILCVNSIVVLGTNYLGYQGEVNYIINGLLSRMRRR